MKTLTFSLLLPILMVGISNAQNADTQYVDIPDTEFLYEIISQPLYMF
jgi:hypothetical protein